jgi:anhydro-N-acetylmuramic acid kinase
MLNGFPLKQKDEPMLVIGLMSGTSADGMDAALTRITGSGTDISVQLIGFVSLPYPQDIRQAISFELK